jgi:hypothetical protein
VKRRLLIIAQVVLLTLIGNTIVAGAALNPQNLVADLDPAQGGQTITQTRPLTPQGSGFTYQGSLKDGPNPANGQYDLAFALFDNSSPPNQIGSTITMTNQTVTNGLFTVTLDFGSGAFQGDGRSLQIAVRQSGGGSYTTLSPRQALTASPYALSLAPGAVISGAASTVISVTNTGSGAGVAGTSTSGYGGVFTSSSGYGIRGISDSSNGGYFTSNSTTGAVAYSYAANGIGLEGQDNNGASAIGVAGDSATGMGVRATSGGQYGLFSAASGTNGTAVYGIANNGANAVGVVGTSSSGDGGVFTSTNAIGIRGTSTTGTGVYGTGGSYGLYGNGTGTGGYGVYGTSANGTGVIGFGSNDGLYGSSTGGTGVYGTSTGGTGMFGTSTATGGFGIQGEADTTNGVGVSGQGTGTGVSGIGGTGVYGATSNANGNYAGDFSGNVRISGTIQDPRWQVTQSFNQHAGPLPLSATFLTSGGTLVIIASGSGYTTVSGGSIIGMNIVLDGATQGWAKVYSNETASHKAFTANALVVPGIAAGSHIITLTALPNTLTDGTDFFSVTVMEFPF